MFLNSAENLLYLNYITNLSLINYEKYNYFKKHLYFLNIFNKYFFKNITHLKSFYYKILKIKKTIPVKHKKQTKKSVVFYKRQYKYFQLFFKVPISVV
jgi:hypothetical protein